MNGRIIVLIAIIPALIFSITLNVYAQDENAAGQMPEEYYDMLGELPDEVSDKLPSGFDSDSVENIGEALTEMTAPKYLFSFIGDILGEGIGDAVKLMARLLGILIISAVFTSFKKSVGGETLSRAVDFCSICVIFSAVIELQISQIRLVSDFFERLNSLMLGMIPVTCAVYAMGGNISTAAASGGSMYAYLAVSEFICAKSVIPITCVCSALALCRGISPHINLQGIASGIRKCYTFVLGLIMTVLLFLLSAQTSITSAADSTGARAAKLIASSMIPVVGGSVAETLRGVGGGIQYIKSVVGVSGIVFILILLLPTFISLLLTRFAFIVSESVANLLGCDGEGRLMGDLGSVYGCMIATVSMCSVMFIFALNIFIKTAVALG